MGCYKADALHNGQSKDHRQQDDPEYKADQEFDSLENEMHKFTSPFCYRAAARS